MRIELPSSSSWIDLSPRQQEEAHTLTLPRLAQPLAQALIAECMPLVSAPTQSPAAPTPLTLTL